MANGDAEGAAMSMGRAALMAAQLAKRQTDPALQLTFQRPRSICTDRRNMAIAPSPCSGGPAGTAGLCGRLREPAAGAARTASMRKKPSISRFSLLIRNQPLLVSGLFVRPRMIGRPCWIRCRETFAVRTSPDYS